MDNTYYNIKRCYGDMWKQQPPYMQFPTEPEEAVVHWSYHIYFDTHMQLRDDLYDKSN